MTDEEKLQAARELDAAYARAEAFDRARGEDDDERRLDAYGHMNWCVGNEDWVACFDAVRVPEGIAFHVVVDCESGGFTDTIESGVVATEKAVEELAALPWRYADTCIEQYLFEGALSDGVSFDVDPDEVKDCAARWEAHLRALAAEAAPEPDEEPSDEYDELRKAALDHRGQP